MLRDKPIDLLPGSAVLATQQVDAAFIGGLVNKIDEDCCPRLARITRVHQWWTEWSRGYGRCPHHRNGERRTSGQSHPHIALTDISLGGLHERDRLGLPVAVDITHRA